MKKILVILISLCGFQSVAHANWLAVLTGSLNMPANSCSSAYTITRSKMDGSPAPGAVTGARGFVVHSSSSSVTFYSDSACTQALPQSTATIPKGSYQISFYAMDSKAETGIQFSLTDASTSTWAIGSPLANISSASRVQHIVASASEQGGSISKVTFAVIYPDSSVHYPCAISSPNNGANYDCAWSVPAGAGQSYTLYTIATDAAGKTSQSTKVGVTSQ